MRPGRLVLSVVVAAWSSSAGPAGAQRVTPDTIPLPSRFFPQIGADLAFVRTLENPYSAIIDVFQQLPPGRDPVYSVTVNASQVLFAGCGVCAGIRLARREREAGPAGELTGTLEGGDAP